MTCTEITTDLNTKPINELAGSNALCFLRVHIERYTAVVIKKPVPLKEALQQKLKNQSLGIDKCVAFDKETNIVINWNIDVDKILADSIAVTQIGEDIIHQFSQKLSFKTEKLAITLRSCYSCKKRNVFLIYVCKKCNYSICQRPDCKIISESVLCRDKRSNSLANSSSTIFKNGKNVPTITSKIGDETNPMSQQILPVKEIKPCFSYRMRSSSDSELKNSNNESKVIDKNNNLTKTLVPLKKIKKRPAKNQPRWDSIISCEIPLNQIKVDTESSIGQGAFGTVRKAQDFYHGLVAIKFLNVQNPSDSQVNSFRNEMAILKSTRHDNILLFIGCLLKPTLAIVTEFCEGSSLYRHIHVDEVHWDMNQIIDIIKQTATGMEYLHARRILHRDLKSNNLFLIPKESNDNSGYSYAHQSKHEDASQWKVKIGDFGLATVASDLMKKNSNPSGSVLWMAPEVIKQKLDDPYSTKSDVYSFAVVLYELVTGHLPYLKKEQNMILFLVGIGRLKLIPDDARSDTPEEILELVKTCSKFDRDDRLEFVEINSILSKIKLIEKKRPQLKRTLSLPNIYLKTPNTYISSKFVLKDDEVFTEIDLLNDSSISPFNF